ncbi:MAG: recombinase family protein [Atopobiaceae bacterium]|nr:recombinase family protein [Atopobiaceae bacterium]
MKTAVLYARYSSDKQREASIDDQLRVCREFCEREGLKVLRAYTDYALSGKTDQRPEFRRMIANAPESDFVVVYMFDRFSRDRYDSIVYKKQLADCGVRVVSATEPVDRTPEGQLQEGMLEVIAAYYVADLARKTRRGMEGNALLAKNNGYKLFGYDTDPDTQRYVVNEAEAEVVREIFARHIAGEGIYGLGRDLAARGYVTTTGSPVDYNWVLRILKRKAYTGLYSWGGIEVKDGMPVIIDPDVFAKAQRVPKRKPREGEEFALYRLTGKLFCAKCGEPMHGSGGTGKSGKRYYYYMCKE